MGIERSVGEFIFFADSDDFLASNVLESLTSYKADLVVGNFNKIINGIFEPNSLSKEGLLLTPEIVSYAREFLRKGNKFPGFVYVWGKLYKSAIIKGNNILFDTALSEFEDILFNFQYLKFAGSAYFVSKPLYSFRVRNYKRTSSLTGYLAALKSIEDYLYYNGIDKNVIKKEIGNSCTNFTIISIIRLCREKISFKYLYKFICDIVSNYSVRNNLRFYVPNKGDNRIIPILVRLRLVWLIIIIRKLKDKWFLR